MDDDLDPLDDERAIELTSIAAIFPELVLDPSDHFTATLDLPITPLTPLRIHFQPAADASLPSLPTPPTSTDQDTSSDSAIKPVLPSQPSPHDQHDLSHLPPLSLKITLPRDYPLTQPPRVTLSTSPPWLPVSKLKELTQDCGRLWEELGRDQVVYTYIDHLQQASENAFGFGMEEAPSLQLNGDLKLELLDFDLKTKLDLFRRGTFDCGVCLEPKKGINCHKLRLCGHVFCVTCLKDFYTSCITEGDVDNVKCLAPSCGKEEKPTNMDARPAKRRKQDRTLNPSELLQIPIEEDLVKRYVRLKRKKALEADKNTVYCPRQWCQGAAKSKKHPKGADFTDDFESEPDEETAPQLQAEEDKKSKKKPKEIPMSERLAVCEDCNYAFCSICKKGWHGVLADCNPRRQAELDDEERASMAYLQNAYLDQDNPYSHFNNMKNSCYMRLWELEAGDGMDVEVNARWEPEPEAEAAWDDDESDSGSDAGSEASVDFLVVGEEDDSDDEEPAPDQRRPGHNMHIEIVNFAREGVNRRIALPQQPVIQAVAQNAPAQGRRNQNQRRRGQGQVANRQRARQNEPAGNIRPPPPHNAVPPLAPQPPAINLNNHRDPQQIDNVINRIAAERAENEPDMIRVRAAPGQENPFVPGQAAPLRAMGLERFLQLAQQDQEDEWDSDELDDDIAQGAMNLNLDLDAHVARPRQQHVQRVVGAGRAVGGGAGAGGGGGNWAGPRDVRGNARIRGR